MVVANSFSKEMAIRKRIASIFNKREEEEVEDMTFNLIEGIDVPAIDGKIAQYHKENAEQIMNAQQFKKKAQARKAEEYAAALAASKGHSDSDPTTSQSFQGGVGAGAQGYYAPSLAGGAIEQPRPTGMAPQPIPIGSNLDMHAYNYNNEEMTRLRAERGGRAGGWGMELSRKRALVEAFSSIWI
ncbi:uncharacterized protein LOC131300033 isoform X1 [Rhododendron vialii]|uniref:uncharacterized protein LOC131300033 isoform X1 n=1 Tax=Rhododendron vialii TaxID=182163 RepID=UPI00265E7492|nr:uncharacterized protein LOC131300033 isoform X1 [Rhododendron vialii]XP_058181661.1 uncharacterized protein LOC131300033 isoform X1 [Rhododendron vialii]XP_058181667.1 uncharacterized protein LOC131300033 isoform X1 [Rhododendron vialii]XP_058181677.1 uncharacterized protein LOC131300033 isoform X1 [Rhododendron vialii]XP_058181683.1 uncharacterized protein LOC131300033 isoform X1 [Rhododendron vialii]XP_058181692.1 uncharacterized protein LOC131300033 isoform X1 [Rhododendron vialii]XP_05